MKCFFCLPFFFYAIACCNDQVIAQSSIDSSVYLQTVSHLRALFYQNIQQKAMLYNGSEYQFYGRGITGSPFFINDSLANTSIMFDGVLYENIPLQYDMVNQAVTIRLLLVSNTIQLPVEKITFFQINNHVFTRITDTAKNTGEPAGFCDVRYNGLSVKVLVKREKKIKYSLNAEDRSAAFVQYDQLLLYSNGQLVSIHSVNDLYALLKNKEKELKHFTKTSKLHFKQNPEQASIQIAKYYDAINR